MLKDAPVFVGGDGALSELLAKTLLGAGAEPYAQGDKLYNVFVAGEAYGRSPPSS